MKSRAVMLALIFFAAVSFSTAFKDVPINHWAYDAVMSVSELGIISGYPDGTFRGVDYVSRYQLAVAIYRTIQYITKALGAPQGGGVVGKGVVDELDRKIQNLKEVLANLKSDYESKMRDVDAKLTQLSLDVSGLSESFSQISEKLEKKLATLDGSIKSYSLRVTKVEKDVLDLKDDVSTIRNSLIAIEKVASKNETSVKDLYSRVNMLNLTVDSSLVDLRNEFKSDLREVKDDLLKSLKKTEIAVSKNSSSLLILEKNVSQLREEVLTKASNMDMAKISQRLSSQEADSKVQWVFIILISLAVIAEGVFLYINGGGIR